MLKDAPLVKALIEDGHQVRESDGRLTVACPFHKDAGESCFFDRDLAGEARFTCQVCGETGGLKSYLMKARGAPEPHAYAEEEKKVFDHKAQTEPLHATSSAASLPLRHSERHNYFDEEGNLAFVVLRIPDEFGGARKIPFHLDRKTENWRRGAPRGKPAPLYGAQLLKQSPKATVLAVASEREADLINAREPKQIGVSWAFGVREWERTDWKPIYARNVVFIASADPDAHDAFRKLARRLGPYLFSSRLVLPPPDGKWDNLGEILEVKPEIAARWLSENTVRCVGEENPTLSVDFDLLGKNEWFSIVGADGFGNPLVRKNGAFFDLTLEEIKTPAGRASLCTEAEWWKAVILGEPMTKEAAKDIGAAIGKIARIRNALGERS